MRQQQAELLSKWRELVSEQSQSGQMILDGIDMSKLKRVPRYERSAGTNKSNPQRVIA